MRFCTLFFLITIPVFVLAQNRVSFTEEYIDFSVDNEYFTINGVYVFVNPTEHPVQQSILFPFGVQADSVDIQRVLDINNGRSIDYRKIRGEIRFNIQLQAYDTLNINIAYRQKTKEVNTYILVSTRAWNEPLQKARYSLTVKEPIRVKEMSYDADSVSGNIYYWWRSGFMPDKNFVVTLKQ